MDTIRSAVERSVKAAKLDEEKSAAPVQMLLKMADTLDAAEDATVFRAITPASFLAYCDRLGMLPNETTGSAQPSVKSNLVALKSRAQRKAGNA